MGREIVYCEGCGVSLREIDFEKGRAREIDHRKYCSACRPEAPAPAPSARSSSSRAPLPSTTTPRRPIPALPPRSHAGLFVGVGVGALVLLVVIAAAAGSGSLARPSPVPAPPPPAPVAAAPAPERRTAEAPPPVRRPAAEQREPEALRPPTEAEKNARFESFLAQIREKIARDEKFEQRAEIEAMLAAAERTAGPRLADVRTVRELHAKTFDDAARAACEAARAEAGRLWAERKRSEAVARASDVPAVFERTRHAEELRKWAAEQERKAAEAEVREREEAVARWKAWKIESGDDVPGGVYLPWHAGRAHVYQTHPDSREKEAYLERAVDVPAGKKTTLSFWVVPDVQGDWELRVLADGKELHKQVVGPKGSGWRQVAVDLSAFAGKRPTLRLVNAANDWAWEYGYWADIELKTE